MPQAKATGKYKPAENTESRRDAVKRRTGKPPDMPSVTGFGYVVAHWQNAGICKAGDMGRKSLEWSDIESWERMTARSLTPWERESIMAMSSAFVVMSELAKDYNCPPPHLMDFGKIDRQAISEGIRRAFMQHVKKDDKRAANARPRNA